MPRLNAIAAPMTLLALLTAASARADTVTFHLEDVWLLPDLSHPGAPARPMTGSFSWTYEEGDYENGVGAVIDLDIPWYWGEVGELEVTFDLTSIEIVYPGSYHDLGLDMTLVLVTPFDPEAEAPIDPVESIFEIQIGISHRGHVISGSIVPQPPCAGDLDLDGAVGVGDLLTVLGGWGTSAGDITGDGTTDVADLLAVLSAWGPCD